MVYHGVLIERNIHGMYVYWSGLNSRYMQFDTLTACKARILLEEVQTNNLTCHYR